MLSNIFLSYVPVMGRNIIRYANAISSGYSFIHSTLTRQPYDSGMPVALGVELTNNCNLACPECNSGSGLMSRQRGYMSIDLFAGILNELNPYLLNLNLYFQGEPMLHPKFFSFIRKSAGIHTTVSTNGHFIDRKNAEELIRSGLGKLIISLDGMKQDTYSEYRRNGDLEKVISGIEYLAEARRRISSKLKIEIQFLVNRINEEQIEEARMFSSRNSIDFILKSMQVINPESQEKWIPSESSFSRYEKRFDKYSIKNKFPNRCSRLWFNPVVTWNGKVLPCCFDKDADHIMGDLNEEKFRDIWTGPRYRLFRRNVLSQRNSIEICRNCTSGLTGVRI